MILVSTWLLHETVLMVFWMSGIVTVLILAMLTKPLMLTRARYDLQTCSKYATNTTKIGISSSIITAAYNMYCMILGEMVNFQKVNLPKS